MSQTKEGGKKTAITNKAKDPDYYAKIGAMGGKAKVKKGFAMMTPEQRSKYGAKGGSISRRKKPVVVNFEPNYEEVKPKRKFAFFSR